MNSNYIYEYSELLERLFSAAHHYKYSTKALEKMISYSSFFQRLEKDNDIPAIISEYDLFKEIFPECYIDTLHLPIYNQCLWAAEAYIRIQNYTGLTFETIFIYIPIACMYKYFDIYHEMDFSQIIDEFNRLKKEKSILSILLNNFNYSIKKVSNITNVSYDTIYSLAHRRRDIKKINIETIFKLSKIFMVRIETLSELKISD